jgi:hypothetical protein
LVVVIQFVVQYRWTKLLFQPDLCKITTSTIPFFVQNYNVPGTFFLNVQIYSSSHQKHYSLYLGGQLLRSFLQVYNQQKSKSPRHISLVNCTSPLDYMYYFAVKKRVDMCDFYNMIISSFYKSIHQGCEEPRCPLRTATKSVRSKLRNHKQKTFLHLLDMLGCMDGWPE